MSLMNIAYTQHVAHGVAYSVSETPVKDNRSDLQTALKMFMRGKQFFQHRYNAVKGGGVNGPLKGKVYNLHQVQDGHTTVVREFAAELERALTELDKKKIEITELQQRGKRAFPVYKVENLNNEQIKEITKEMKSIATAVLNLENLLRQNNALTKIGHWARIRDAFLKGGDKSRAFFERISMGNPTNDDLVTFLKRTGGAWRRSLGYAMEDIMTQVLTDIVSLDDLENMVSIHMADNIKKVPTRAEPGTIRAVVQGLSLNSSGGLARKGGGMPLKDIHLEFDIDGEVYSTGISSKRYNFGAEDAKIHLGKLSLGNYVNFINQLSDANNIYPMYTYRAYDYIDAGSDKEDHVGAYYLAGMAAEGIFKGKNYADATNLNDQTDLMIINGYLMDVSTMMQRGTPKVRVSNLPGRGGAWIDPDEAMSFIGQLHASKIETLLEVNAKTLFALK